MSEPTTQFEEVVTLALTLTPLEKVRLMERLAATLEHELASERKEPLLSLRGLWAGLDVDISAEDIDEIRRERG